MSFSFSITTYREFRTLIWSVCNLLLEKIPKQIHKSERKKITIKIGVAFSGAFRFFPENWDSRVRVPNLHGTRRVWTELMGPFMNLQGEWSSLSLPRYLPMCIYRQWNGVSSTRLDTVLLSIRRKQGPNTP